MKYFSLLLFTFSTCIPSFAQTATLSKYDSTYKMPPFVYYNLKGDTFTPDSLNKKWKTVEVFFNPGCEHCEKQAKIIGDSAQEFLKTQFIFVSDADTDLLRKFASDYHLLNHPNVIMLYDKNHQYYKFTITHFTPSVHIYDKKRNLTYFAEGVLNKNQLHQYLKKK